MPVIYANHHAMVNFIIHWMKFEDLCLKILKSKIAHTYQRSVLWQYIVHEHSFRSLKFYK